MARRRTTVVDPGAVHEALCKRLEELDARLRDAEATLAAVDELRLPQRVAVLEGRTVWLAERASGRVAR